MKTAQPTAAHQLCSCRVGPLLIGIEVLSIQEVLYHTGHTAIPRTADAITGLINLRGQIATTIDLRVRLGVEPSPDAELVHVVVRYRGEPVSLLVDEVGDVIDVDSDTFEPTPDNVEPVVRELLTGAYKLSDELLLTIDLDKTIATSNNRSTAARGPMR
ncbi:MAG: chemotaxis protein CheW [Actinomycetota bacterium]